MSNISICTPTVIKNAATSLMDGNLVAFPTETVYGLGADATNEDAIRRIYEVKARPVGHPIIVHISSVAFLHKWARDIPDYALKLASAFWPGPMTLILPRTYLAKDFITGGQDNVGIRVPSHAVALSLLAEFEDQGGFGVAAPSANRFGKVSPTTSDAVSEELSEFLSLKDLIIDGGACDIGIESTIIDCTRSVPNLLRPGAISEVLVFNELGIYLNDVKKVSHKVKAPGLLESHYAPKALVYLSGAPMAGDGLIAISIHKTPKGVFRLASPVDNFDFGNQLYSALRLADRRRISRVFIIPPIGEGIAIAINDRLLKCAYKID